MNERDLIQALYQRQKDLGMTDLQFAKRLNVSRQTWQIVRTGGVEPSAKILRGIATAFPDLMPDVLAFLLAESASTQAKKASTLTETVP